ncbi:hypothetical protein F4679DRAFT_589677 [Xylaria curta]|nr:hypothetical protein F4679DRAFT_589677 [Xylaria curta]
MEYLCRVSSPDKGRASIDPESPIEALSPSLEAFLSGLDIPRSPSPVALALDSEESLFNRSYNPSTQTPQEDLLESDKLYARKPALVEPFGQRNVVPEENPPPKRVQKHPATFQCNLCPTRFTRAYNLHSHLRTHTESVKLIGGIANTGRPVELVRDKENGRAISLATGEPVEMGGEQGPVRFKRSLSQQAEDEEEIMRSMARRKKNAMPEELALKKCSHAGCNKEFKRPCDLTKHEKTHSRTWKCPIPTCKYYEYGWPTEKELTRHVNDKHSATTVMFECEYKPCTYRSKRASNCKQHMEKAHGWTYKRSKGPKTKGSKEGSSTNLRPVLKNLSPSRLGPKVNELSKKDAARHMNYTISEDYTNKDRVSRKRLCAIKHCISRKRWKGSTQSSTVYSPLDQGNDQIEMFSDADLSSPPFSQLSSQPSSIVPSLFPEPPPEPPPSIVDSGRLMSRQRQEIKNTILSIGQLSHVFNQLRKESENLVDFYAALVSEQAHSPTSGIKGIKPTDINLEDATETEMLKRRKTHELDSFMSSPHPSQNSNLETTSQLDNNDEPNLPATHSPGIEALRHNHDENRKPLYYLPRLIGRTSEPLRPPEPRIERQKVTKMVPPISLMSQKAVPNVLTKRDRAPAASYGLHSPAL